MLFCLSVLGWENVNLGLLRTIFLCLTGERFTAVGANEISPIGEGQRDRDKDREDASQSIKSLDSHVHEGGKSRH